ncbi:MAG TPA: hypothetical protein VI381_06970, partial [Allosphingosinicella sp.]
MMASSPVAGREHKGVRRRTVWALALAVLLLTGAAVLFAAQNWITGGPYGRLVWPRNLTVALVQWWSWLPFVPLLLYLVERDPRPSRRARGIWALTLIAAFGLHLLLVTAIERGLDHVTPGERLDLTAANLLRKRFGIDLFTLAALVFAALAGRSVGPKPDRLPPVSLPPAGEARL